MFTTLPLLPPLVTLVRDSLGAGALSGILYALLAALLLREPVTWLRIAGLLIGAGGVALVTFG